jgi:hypothetical protein
MGDTFSGFGEALLGGTDEAHQTGQAQTLTPEQQQLLNTLIGQTQGQIGQGVTPYQGQMVADPSQLQQDTWADYNNLQNNYAWNPSNPDSQSAINQILQGTPQGSIPGAVTAGQATPQQVNVGDYDPAATQSWWNQAVYDPAMQNWQQNVVPEIQENFISQNAGSSGAANRAIAGSAADLQSSLGASLADAMNQERLNTQNQQLQANMFNAGNDLSAQQQFYGNQFAADTNAANMIFGAGQADQANLLNVPGMVQTNQAGQLNNYLNMLGATGQAGQQQTALNQAGLNADYQNWQMGQAYNNPWLNMLPTALGTTSFEPIVQGPVQNQGLMSSFIMPMMNSASNAGASWYGASG